MPKVLNKHRDVIPRGSVYIGRGSPWGNPFKVGIDGNRDEVINRFRVEILPNLDLRPLHGKDLVCFCAPKKCHGDVIMEVLYAQENAH